MKSKPRKNQNSKNNDQCKDYKQVIIFDILRNQNQHRNHNPKKQRIPDSGRCYFQRSGLNPFKNNGDKKCQDD